jgi:hypothetical protein
MQMMRATAVGKDGHSEQVGSSYLEGYRKKSWWLTTTVT